MVTRLSKSRYQSIASINKMLDKYGHDCTVVVSNLFPTPVPAKVLFANYDFTIQGGDLVLDANYKLLLKAVALPDMLQPTSIITVNGTDMQALTVKKLTPDGTNAIVWEVSAFGTVLPDDTDNSPSPPAKINKPAIVSTKDAASNIDPSIVYPEYPWATTGKYFPAIEASAYSPVAVGQFASIEWQVSTDSGFTSTIVNVVATDDMYVPDFGVIIPATQLCDATYPLSKGTTYYARVRYNSVDNFTSEWSDTFVFAANNTTNV